MKKQSIFTLIAISISFCVTCLSGCVAPDVLATANLPENLRQTAHEMRLRGAYQCTTHKYEQSSGRKLTGDVKISTEVTLRRFYISDNDWYKAEIIGNGVIDNIFYSPKTGKFVCGQKNWDSYSDTKNIAFQEYGVIENTIGHTTPNNNSKFFPQTESHEPVLESRSIAVSWDGYDNLISGVVNLNSNMKSIGHIKIALPNNDGNCSGQSKQVDQRSGVWSISCTNGMVASGTYEAYGDGKGASGIGTDLRGKQVKYTIAPRN